jgi:protein required for attachment to host cells
MTLTWIVVADNSRARFFTTENSSSPLEEIDTLTHTEGRMHDREITQDLPGKIKNPGGASGHAYEQPTDPKQYESSQFAHRIGHYLQEAHNANRISRLLIVAEPSMLGLLRKEIPEQVRKLITFELDKNIASFTAADIRSHLPSHFPS